MCIKKRNLELISYIYIYISVLSFLWGWCKPILAVIATAVIIYSIIRLDAENKENDSAILIDDKALVFTIVIFLVVGYYAGWGRFTPQSGDWAKHNAIIADLVNKSWPVYYHNGQDDSMLTYYIGQYLVPCSFGKLFHSVRAAEIFIYLWAEVGLILVNFNVLKLIKSNEIRTQIVAPILLCFFSCPLPLAHIIQGIIYRGISNFGNLNWLIVEGTLKLQYSDNFTLLRWVFPQVIVMWLTMTLWIEHRHEVQHYVAILLPSMLYGTLSFLGVLPLAFAMTIAEFIGCKQFKNYVKRLFSLSNILMTLSVGVIFIAYFYGNVTGDKPEDIGFQLVKYGQDNWGQYIIFVVVMVGLYAVILWKSNKKNIIFIASIIELTVLPLFYMGAWNDLVMRGSIPPLFIIYLSIVEFLDRYNRENIDKKQNERKAILLIMVLSIASIYPIKQLSDVMAGDSLTEIESAISWTTLEDFANRQAEDIAEDVKYNYYSYDIQDNFFYKYIAQSKE